MLETLGSGAIDASDPMLSMAFQPGEIVSTRSAITAAKKAVAASAGKRAPSQPVFRTAIRAEVMCIGDGKARSFRVYSRELYACTDRNLRKLCVPLKTEPTAENADRKLPSSE